MINKINAIFIPIAIIWIILWNPFFIAFLMFFSISFLYITFWAKWNIWGKDIVSDLIMSLFISIIAMVFLPFVYELPIVFIILYIFYYFESLAWYLRK